MKVQRQNFCLRQQLHKNHSKCKTLSMMQRRQTNRIMTLFLIHIFKSKCIYLLEFADCMVNMKIFLLYIWINKQKYYLNKNYAYVDVKIM